MDCELEEQEYLLGFMIGENFIFRVFIIWLIKSFISVTMVIIWETG